MQQTIMDTQYKISGYIIEPEEPFNEASEGEGFNFRSEFETR